MPSSETGSTSKSLVVNSNRPIRMAGFASLIVLSAAIYVGFDVNQAIGQNRNMYDVAIPATRLLSDIEFDTQEVRHDLMHANLATNATVRDVYTSEFERRKEKVAALLVRLEGLRLPNEMRPRLKAFERNWTAYLELSGAHDHTPDPGIRDRQFQEISKSGRLLRDSLDAFATTSATNVRMAFVRAGFELVLLLLGTLYMISVLATNGQRRKTMESLRVINKRLQLANAAAEESSKLKSEFLATVSHEIRTPMNGIIGMAELLSRSGLNEEQKSYNENVRLSAEALLSILNDILDFSRIEAGKLVIEAAPFAVCEPVFQIADLLASAAAQKGLELVVRIAPNLPRQIVGDAGRVRQVLMNLAGNAIKFTHSGHILVEVEALESPLESSATHCRLKFSVADTGIGIAEEKLDTLFDKFTQADASTTRKYGGTGLGLAISHKLVELMGGTIAVESQDGVGSTFSFVLNAAIADAATPIQGPFAERSPQVLLIEPSSVSARTIAEMLSFLGARVRCTLSAEDALAILEAGAAQWQAVFISSRVQVNEPGLFVRIQRLLGKGNRLVVLAPRGQVDPKLVARDIRVVAKPPQLQTLEDALRQAMTPRSLLPAPGLRTRDQSVANTLNLRQLAESVGRPVTVSSAGLRVLVAEDNIVNQTIVRKLLEGTGCRVDVAANGRTAVSQWEDGEYDLILMDCQMPELDGFEATREIRRRETSGERVPIIAITANVLDKDRTHCFAAGMDDFLSKPLRLVQLQAAVERWTSGGRQTVASA